MRVLFFYLFLLSGLYAQGKRDYIWHLGGSNSSKNDTNFWRFNIDFNGNQRKIYLSHKDYPVSINNASICDKNGNFLFYTTGCWISDKSFNKMNNGYINQGAYHDFTCSDGDYRVPFGTIILPESNSDQLFFVISKYSEFVQDSLSVLATTKLLYSIVDMTLNNSYGEVVTKNQIVIDKYLSASDLTAVRHSNNEDWWILVPSRTSNVYYSIQMTKNGPLPFIQQTIGMDLYPLDDGGTQSCFSPDGTKYARMTPSKGLFLMDFDRKTGTLSNFRNVVTGSETNDHTVGVAFSPDSRFVYLSYRFDLYQVDSWMQDIQSSLVHIDTWDGYVDEGIWAAGFDAAMLGPDCKIYIRTGTSNKVMHVINDPNKKGKDCNFQQHGIQLPAWNHASIPNFVNYRLGYEPVCDSNLVMTFSLNPDDYVFEPLVYPNPVKDKLVLEFLAPNYQIKKVSFYTLTGELISDFTFQDNSQKRIIDCGNLSKGIYLVRILTNNGRCSIKKLVK
jgi:hypothetical protein